MADVGHQYGRIDILVNNAGIAIDRGQAAASADMEKVRATLDTNTSWDLALLHCSHP
ncbi:SDR family NAD(P)-dependent oxidoreductase [Micromonospora luteifusca]